MRLGNRPQVVVALLGAAFLILGLALVIPEALRTGASPIRTAFLLSVLVLLLVAVLLCLSLLLRWLVRPYRQLVGEAQRVPISADGVASHDEGEFVLQTFQSIVARLQEQQRELTTLHAAANLRADSAKIFSDRIVASVPSGLLAFDGSGATTMVNAPARALLNADEDVLGTPVHGLLGAVPDLVQLVEKCLKTGEIYRRAEVVAAAANGRLRRFGVTVSPIDPVAPGAERGALCLLTDITEVTELREQLTLKKNLESMGEMSAGLAHEFKNALATLQGYAQLMETLPTDERGRAAASAMLGEVRHLNGMVSAFLDFARPKPLALTAISLNEMVNDCARELAPLYEKLRVDLRILGDLAEIKGDEVMLRQALLNLIRNAAEAIDESALNRSVGVEGRVDVDQNASHWAVVEISDSGSGLPDGDPQKIFIPFFTTKDRGHGIGLALAHRVITAHEGSLTAANRSPHGAVFTVRLPKK
jgi:signal transduction histidine kinase